MRSSTAGAGHDDVHAAAQRLLLGALADAAEHRGHAQARGLGQQGDGRGDLRGELAGRREDEARGCCGRALTPVRGAPREREGEGLAAAGAATAEQVAAGEESGRVPCWMGKASVLPSAARTEASSAGTPSSRKEGMDISWTGSPVAYGV
jgi:hypothetical protein